ncbi:hypothetical protein [Bathycoccus sp. RCC716 virus 1]|uniref:Uncharacterized protein n=1 Tax=Bathycoccus sp. RCC716 virus 1 TaxID=2530038 RepID=A0A7S6NXU8_9PHYC|nr:hypothetical protein [Bathycoccus sp. RCC716 virus 1]
MTQSVEEYIKAGIYFSNELMDAIEDVTRRYEKHVSVSIEIGHFTDLDKNLMRLSRTLIRYNQQYINLMKDLENGHLKEDMIGKTGLETIAEE